jgi:DNA polymerase IV
MKILCVLLPHFPLRCEALRQPEIEGCPAIVTSPLGSQKLVLDYSPELPDLQRNMPLQQALSRYGEARLIQADVPYYWSVFNSILDALETKSPLVESFDLGQAYLGLDGLQGIYPDDQSLVKSVREAVPASFSSQMGISQGKFLAYLAALDSPAGGCRVLSGQVEAFLCNLPCEVLPVSIKSKDKLRDFGITTLGQIGALPVGPLQAQFGPEGRLIGDLARGEDETPLYPRFMEENIDESTVLSSVTVSLEAILITVEALLSRVFARDSLNGRGIRSMNVWTRGWTSEYWEHGLQFKEPAMEIKSVISRLKPFLENFPQPGPVEQVGLKITGLGYRNGRQRSLFAEIRARDHLLEDIRQLELRMGGPQVFKVKEVEPWSRIPERRYVLTPLSR